MALECGFQGIYFCSWQEVPFWSSTRCCYKGRSLGSNFKIKIARLSMKTIKKPLSQPQLLVIKLVIFVVCLIPLFKLLWLGFQQSLSANPTEYIERSTGYWSLMMLLATLALTPIWLTTGRAWPLQLRRMLGLYMFFYACLHVVSYVWIDFGFDWQGIWHDIAKHPRILVGFFAFLLTVPLALTSNKAMIKRLRERWKKLHQMIYLIAILAIVHFWMLVKKDIREPLLYAVVLFVLFSARIYYKKQKLNKIKVN